MGYNIMTQTRLFLFILIMIMVNNGLAKSPSLQDIFNDDVYNQDMVIIQAKEIITLDPENPVVEAVAINNGHIIATGSFDQLRQKFINEPHKIDSQFKELILTPGFIAQHDHPLLAGITMTSEVIAIEDWITPDRTFKAAKNQQDYLQKLSEAEGKMNDPHELLLTWGYHHYFHGFLKKSQLDAISRTRPIIVWHRSAHEMYINSAAEKKYGVTEQWYNNLTPSQKAQSDFENGHYWEQGWFALGPLLMNELASAERLTKALQFVERYFHTNGITAGAEPGGVLVKSLQDAQNQILGDAENPFRFFFIADGKTLAQAGSPEEVINSTNNLLKWNSYKTQFLPNQVKLFADGAIFSQAMQLREPYSDGHEGEWMMDLDFFAKAFKIYWDAGFQIHVHVNGDKGLDMLLSELEKNLQNNPRPDHRTVVVHFAVSQPDQINKIKSLGAIVSANPYYPIALSDNYRENGLDHARADSMVRLGDVERAGISFSLHSDMPMAPGRPLFLMHSAVNRITNDGNLRGSDQRVSRLAAFKAITSEAAFSLRLEERMGTIEPGKDANFTILDDNPLTIDAAEIKNITVMGTILEGDFYPTDAFDTQTIEEQ